MLEELIQFGLGMAFVIGLMLFLWGLANHMAEKKHRLHERIADLEQWKGGEELRQSRARRIRKARREANSRTQRLARDKAIWQNELEAALDQGDAFDQAYKELLDGAE